MAITIEKINKWAAANKVNKLEKAVKSKNKEIALAGIRAYGKVDDIDSINFLVNLLRNRDKDVRMATLDALQERSAERAVEFIKAAITAEKDPEVLEKCKKTIAAIRESNE